MRLTISNVHKVVGKKQCCAGWRCRCHQGKVLPTLLRCKDCTSESLVLDQRYRFEHIVIPVELDMRLGPLDGKRVFARMAELLGMLGSSF